MVLMSGSMKAKQATDDMLLKFSAFAASTTEASKYIDNTYTNNFKETFTAQPAMSAQNQLSSRRRRRHYRKRYDNAIKFN